jgi:hypothetical protein
MKYIQWCDTVCFIWSSFQQVYGNEMAEKVIWLIPVWCLQCDVCSLTFEIWCWQCDVWNVMCGIWCLQSGAWNVMYVLWCMPNDVCSAMYAVWCLLCDVYVMWRLQCGAEMWCILVLFAIWYVRYDVSSVTRCTQGKQDMHSIYMCPVGHEEFIFTRFHSHWNKFARRDGD